MKKYKSLISYGVFGILTTVVNLVTYNLCYYQMGIGNTASNIIAWILSVVFAFVTNKLFVFESKDKSKKESLKELFNFFGFRLLSLGIDTLALYLLLNVVNVGEMIAKIISNVVVIILNYIFSKLFVFKK